MQERETAGGKRGKTVAAAVIEGSVSASGRGDIEIRTGGDEMDKVRPLLAGSKMETSST
jgi:hypothetical protein